MADLRISHSNYILRKKRQLTSKGGIYERDWMTVSELDGFAPGTLPVYASGNFKMTVPSDRGTTKKYSFADWKKNDGEEFWTLNNLTESEIKVERALLNPNYTSLLDFAYYGSAVELVNASIMDIIMKFPGELYFSDNSVEYQEIQEDGSSKFAEFVFYGDEDYYLDGGKRLYEVKNPFGINVNAEHARPNEVTYEDRYLCLSFDKYEVIFAEGEKNEKRFSLCWVPTNYPDVCLEGIDMRKYKIVDSLPETGMTNICYLIQDDIKQGAVVYKKFRYVDNAWMSAGYYYYHNYTLLYTVDLGFTTIYGIYANGREYIMHDGTFNGVHIRLKKEYIDEAFERFDDFERVLLNRDTKPIYRAKLTTPKETENGTIVYDRYYDWPTLYGWNLDISGDGFESYAKSLLEVAQYYDENRADNMFRSYTHESIKNFDWTTPRDTYVPEIDGDIIDTERVASMIRVFGRQFDDLKRSIENIKFTTKISYDSKNNMSWSGLAKFLEMNGWAVKNVAPSDDNNIVCRIEYGGKTLKVKPEDCNIEFLRRMILNSRNILSKKGTMAGIKTVYSLFGLDESSYTISEYTSAAYNFPGSNEDGTGAYDMAVAMNNKKDNFQRLFDDTSDDLAGLMAATVEYNGIKYIVPWYDPTVKYDNDAYYQMYGGWGKRDSKKINLDIASGTTRLESSPDFSIYDETIKNVKIVGGYDVLNEIPTGELEVGDVYYVYDITMAYIVNGCNDEAAADYSHYAVLEERPAEDPTYPYVPYSDDYIWRVVTYSELVNPTTDVAKRIVYLESINDCFIGNNPHDGKGHYDDGKAYLDALDKIFKGTYDKDLFSGYVAGVRAENAKRSYENRFRTEQAEMIPNLATEDYLLSPDFSFGIDGDIYEDNKKIYYFFSGESPILDGDSGLYRENHEISNANKSNNLFVWDLGYESPLTDEVVEEDYEDSDLNIPTSISELTGHKQHDLSSYSIINTKNIKITYHLSRHCEDYITNVVEFYVKQMIPSTAIVEFVWDYTDGGVGTDWCYTENFGMVSDDTTIFAGVATE